MNKMPWFKFYPSDWIKGTRQLTSEEKAALIDIFCFMWESPTRGKIVSDWPGIARMTGLEWSHAEIVIVSLQRCGALDVVEVGNTKVTNSNTEVTLISRRMMRDQKRRDSNILRQREFKKRKSNTEVTDKTQKSYIIKDLEDSLELSFQDTPKPTASLLTFQTVGKTKEWFLTEAFLKPLKEAYPDLNVLAECKRALAWVLGSPRHRKTASGMGKFLTAWMGRAQNNGSRLINDTSQGEPDWRMTKLPAKATS
jgi:uncharacterized protein YdaU (DUF1376 family)